MKIATLTTMLLACLAWTPAVARDTQYMLPLAEVFEMPEAKSKLDGTVKFYLAGDSKAPKVLQTLGEDISNRKTNGVGKEDKEACKWAALSALIAFQDRAKQLGANAVVDIVSYYKKVTFSSASEYECHAGAMIVGVALKGSYVKAAD